MEIHAIIFDLGGTLIDWPGWNEDANRRWALSYNYLVSQLPSKNWPDCDAYVKGMREAELSHWRKVNEHQGSGTPTSLLRDGFHTLHCQISDEELVVALSGYARAVNGWAMIFPDTVATLLELRHRGYRLGLLSNTWWAADWHNADLATHGLAELLDEVVYTSDLPHSKPHPSTFLEVARRLQVEPQACVMVGDRMIDDISGALSVGMRAIWKKPDAPHPQHMHIIPSAIISTLSELIPLLDHWEHA